MFRKWNLAHNTSLVVGNLRARLLSHGFGAASLARDRAAQKTLQQHQFVTLREIGARPASSM